MRNYVFCFVLLGLCFCKSTAYGQGTSATDNDADYAKAMGYVEKGNYKKAVKILSVLSDANYDKASHQLGLIYKKGNLKEGADYESACNQFKKVIEHKYPQSNTNTEATMPFQKNTERAITLMFPPGISKQEAVNRTAGLARTGDAAGMFQYAGYMEITEKARNVREIERYYRQSANHGFMAAAYHLAMLYEKGDILTKDMKAAAEWYGKVSDFCINGPKPVKLVTLKEERISQNAMAMVLGEDGEYHTPEPIHMVSKITVAVGDEFSFRLVVKYITDDSIGLEASEMFTGGKPVERHILEKGSSLRFYDKMVTDAHNEYIYSYAE